MQLTTNTQAFIEAEVESQFILMNLHDGLLGEQFYRNISDFSHGSQLNIKTVGSVTLQECSENVALDYSPIESGTINFALTDSTGDAWFVTDDLREDGNQVEALMTARSVESTRAFQEHFESRFFEVANAGQTNADANSVNGFAHRVASAETNNVFALGQLASVRLAFNKANVPSAGRVLFIDPVAETTLTNLITVTSDISSFGVDVLKQGFASGMEFSMRLYGFDIIVSNRLPVGSFSDGTTAVTGAVANIAMCVLDDQTKPVMGAIRRVPSVEGERNKDLRRDEFTASGRFGLGVQRLDTLAVIITSATKV